MSEEMGEGDVIAAFEQAGFSADQALLLFERGVDFSFACDWLRLYPSASAEEISEFFVWDSDSAMAWRAACFEVADARAWVSAGVALERAEQLDGAGFSAAEFVKWDQLSPGVDPLVVVDQLRCFYPGVSLSECFNWFCLFKDLDSPQQLEDWLRSDFCFDDVARLLEAGVDGGSALLWRRELPGCSARLVVLFAGMVGVSCRQAVRWLELYAEEPPELVAFVAARIGSLENLRSLHASCFAGAAFPPRLGEVKDLLDGLPEITPPEPGDSDQFQAHFARGRFLIEWLLEFPDLSVGFVLDFVERSGPYTPGEILEWHREFPDDPPEVIAGYANANVPQPPALLLRRDLPDLDPARALGFAMNLGSLVSRGAAWQQSLEWLIEFPELSVFDVVEFCERLGVKDSWVALFWCRRDRSLSAAEIIDFTEQATGASPPESSDMALVAEWLQQFPEDSAALIRSYLECFEGELVEQVLSWRASGLEPELAKRFYECLFFRYAETALEYFNLGVSPEVAGEWDCAFHDTSLASHSGLAEWLEFFPEMSVGQVYQLAQWFHYGFDSAAEVADWVGRGIDVFDALLFVACGCSDAQLAAAWLERGFSGPDASRLLGDRWLPPDQLESLSGGELQLDNRELLFEFGAAGFDVEQASQWISSGVVSALVASEWREAGFGPASAALWISAGCRSPELALAWWQRGATAPRAAEQLQRLGVSWEDFDDQRIRFDDSSFEWQTRDQLDPAERLR